MTNDAFQNTLANDQRLIENALQQLLPPTVFDQGEVTGTTFWSRPALWNMYTLTA